ncbi:AraC family transcriptional regulator [Mesorhizobium sp. LNJC391B00]|uniref:helix-turn-helix domain-containing protein n=1 Tax=Mesorhizobium sp. LNJC391B00 TaxID=1287273 RepID=UPI0003CDE35A|nr:AraC family transcriptional regulator [Mesorhizobium sp. LNJC391B00]
MTIEGLAPAVLASELSTKDADAVTEQATPRATSEDSAVAAAVDALMRSKELYRDVDLNLGRIARRLGLPARQVSSTVNRIHGSSVSQYVNDQRIGEACRLLAASDEPITRIMFDAGFLSKSNVNREFLRVTGLSPKAWRLEHRTVEAKSRGHAVARRDKMKAGDTGQAPTNSRSAMRL